MLLKVFIHLSLTGLNYFDISLSPKTVNKEQVFVYTFSFG